MPVYSNVPPSLITLALVRARSLEARRRIGSQFPRSRPSPLSSSAARSARSEWNALERARAHPRDTVDRQRDENEREGRPERALEDVAFGALVFAGGPLIASEFLAGGRARARQRINIPPFLSGVRAHARNGNNCICTVMDEAARRRVFRRGEKARPGRGAAKNAPRIAAERSSRQRDLCPFLRASIAPMAGRAIENNSHAGVITITNVKRDIARRELAVFKRVRAFPRTNGRGAARRIPVSP